MPEATQTRPRIKGGASTERHIHAGDFSRNGLFRIDVGVDVLVAGALSSLQSDRIRPERSLGLHRCANALLYTSRVNVIVARATSAFAAPRAGESVTPHRDPRREHAGQEHAEYWRAASLGRD